MPGHITRLLWATISLKRLQYTRRSELIYSTKENVAGTKKKKKRFPTKLDKRAGTVGGGVSMDYLLEVSDYSQSTDVKT